MYICHFGYISKLTRAHPCAPSIFNLNLAGTHGYVSMYYFSYDTPCMYIHICICIYIYVYVWLCMLLYTNHAQLMYIYIYIYVYVYIYIIYIHIIHILGNPKTTIHTFTAAQARTYARGTWRKTTRKLGPHQSAETAAVLLAGIRLQAFVVNVNVRRWLAIGSRSCC